MLTETESRQAVTHLLPYFWPHHIDPEDGKKKSRSPKHWFQPSF